MIEKILEKDKLTRDDLIKLLSIEDEKDMNKLFNKAYSIKEKYIGKISHYRGLIEFSNYCIKDCNYCGIRKSNSLVDRFFMNKEEILKMAKWALDNEYGSITLQSGERTDTDFVNFVTEVISDIKEMSKGKLGLTLCMGEQSEDVYKKWFEAGGHRYLLRIETTNENLYNHIHPKNNLHSFKKRVDCLKSLKKIGYQVGTGVLIGVPNQTIEDLADDILFFKDMDIDMIGMGPYIVHKDTPIGKYVLDKQLDTVDSKNYRFLLGLKMIAVTRIFLKDVNIAATTALQALDSLGREKGLKAGANILMPIITLEDYREKYQLYDNKPCIEDNANKCKSCLTGRVMSIGEKVGFGEFGDSKHFFNKIKSI
ncbi:[FeFe] hydrogenase H-cluster radical SAM maturase HydE [[Clostridium] colinum]|uniref:[FeFe] hydrogenase H-cluster radical SAM maturase HydE n=1 Tax=[Clostridium] colinum TaxID=36835 RepID=UPI0020244D3E|nr:[FeFe] hydrogenase H-cluster radical SAM maturase HydE [[Clostridium] colinum]